MQNPVEKIKSLQEKALLKSASKEVKLPYWPDNKRGTPNSFLCSALFSATQSKDREFLKGVVLASQGDITIKFTGESLNQQDLTLWETLVHLSREHPLENRCEFTAYEILKKMGIEDGGDERDRLHKDIIRLTGAVVEIIINNSKAYFGSLIFEGAKDENTGHYAIRLNKQLIKLYQQNTWVDWEQRVKLRRKPLAQALHGYYSSHKTPYPVKIETLHKLTGSKNKRMSDFKQKTIAALEELIKVGFLKSYSIDDDKVTIKKCRG